MTYFVQQLVNGLALGSTYALIALAFVLVFGVLKVFNAALAGLVVLGAYSAWFVASSGVSSFWLALAAAIVVTVIAGAIVDRAAIAPVVKRNSIAPFLTTLGCVILIEGIVRTFFSAQPRSFQVPFPSAILEVAGVTTGSKQLAIIGAALALVLACDVVITRTSAGRALRAVAEDPLLAMTHAIDARKVRLLATSAASVLAAITGVLLGVSYGSISPTMGITLMLKGFIILSVAGFSSFRGAAVVGVLLGVLEVMATAYMPTMPREALVYGILVFIMLIKPEGLLGAAPRLRVAPRRVG